MSYAKFQIVPMQDESFEGLKIGAWFKKAFKPPKFLRKIIPKEIRKLKPGKILALPFTLPLATVGILKPKAVDIGVGKKFAKQLVTASRIGTAIVGAAVLGPALLPAITKGGMVAMGGLKWLGGKLMSVPKGVGEILQGQGYPDVDSAPIEALIDAAQQAGALTPEMMQQALAQSGGSYPMPTIENPPISTQYQYYPEQLQQPAEAGMFPGGGMDTKTMMLMGGLGLVAILLTQKK
jgi:hypothetical protein